MKVPLCRPSIDEAEIERVVEVLRSGWLAHGEYNHKFEAAFAELVGVEHAVGMSSCTSALELALRVAGIKGEVILPSFTFVASANAVVNAGCRPVFCEVDVATRNVTAELIAPHIRSETAAVMVVHFGGQPCQMDGIVDLCQRHDLVLLEDSAETLGASWNGAQAGSFGIGCFSFFPTKNITTAEGGMLVCRDRRFADEVRALVAHGIRSTTAERERGERPWRRTAAMAGHNYRMAHPLAALGYEQLRRLPELNRRRVELARRYDEELRDLGDRLRTPVVASGATHVYQMYTVTVGAEVRDSLVRELRSRGIGASVHFDPPAHLHPPHRGWAGDGGLPQTEELARTILTLPLFPGMSGEQQDVVLRALHEILLDS